VEIACLDLEGVLVPEIWIAFAEKTGIEALKKTTRDEPDYDVLMRYRLDILREQGLGLNEIQEVIATLEPLPGAIDFVDWLRERFQVVILSDTFYEFASPLMKQLGYPTLLCHKLETADDGTVIDYHLRQANPKRQAVVGFKSMYYRTIYHLRQANPKRQAVVGFKSMYYRTIAAGDSYNDTTMLAEADAGILFHAPDNVIAEFPQFPAVQTFADLKREFIRASNRDLSL